MKLPQSGLSPWLCFLRAGWISSLPFLSACSESALHLCCRNLRGSNSTRASRSGVFHFCVPLRLYGGNGCRDWRIRWVAMFLSGALAARLLVFIFADRASEAHGSFCRRGRNSSLRVAAFNLLICCYLAFYPGMARLSKRLSHDCGNLAPRTPGPGMALSLSLRPTF